MNPTLRDLVAAIEETALPSWQEDYDNTGWQILMPDALDKQCSGLMLCVDITPEIIAEASKMGCNMILTHHPLLFRGLKRIDASWRVGRCVIEAIQSGISVYSCHTAIDSAPGGVSHALAEKMLLTNIEVLSPGKQEGVGIGVVGNLPYPLSLAEVLKMIKQQTGSPVARCSGNIDLDKTVSRIAIGGGACGDLIPEAVRKDAQIMITSDVKHNMFIDNNSNIIVIDLGHYETEQCTKDIFYDIITKKFPNFVPYYSKSEKNPITYL